MRLHRYEELIRAAQDEIAQYELWAGQRIAAEQRRAIEVGFEAAVKSVGAEYLPVMVNRAAVANMIGLCADGAPLFSLLHQRALGPWAVEGLVNALVEAVALGYNPRKTARLMADGLAQGLDKALLIARTEQIRAYREATRAGYKAMGVQQYRRHCAKSDRTCLACLAVDGKIYPTEEITDSHPNCRCFTTPIIPGDTDDRASAQEWFAGLDEKRQREILGRGHFELYQKGVPLSEMVQVRDDPVWGPTLGVKPLVQIDPDWTKQYKQGLTQEFVNRMVARRANLAVLQQTRVDEIASMGADQVGSLITKIRKAAQLPKPGYHFNEHGQAMGFATQQDYLDGFKQFIQRDNLRTFTSINEKSGDRMWYLLDRSNGFIAQYNETVGKPWSFYRAPDIGRFLGSHRNWFVEVRKGASGWETERW